ncbi:MAG: hypothetical protein Q7U87_02005 [bacterium]|nr:hypothetical protein [bacterium]
MNKKSLFIAIFLTVIGLSNTNAQIDSLDRWFHLYFQSSASLKNQINIRFDVPFEYVKIPYSFESSFINTAIVKQNKYYISSNSLILGPLFLASAFYNGFRIEGPYYAITAAVIMSPQMLGNFKIGYAMNKNVAFMVGQNTDYYLLYDVARVFTESAVGIKYSNNHIRVILNFCYPWSKGYFNDEKPYIRFGFSYFSEFPVRIDI